MTVVLPPKRRAGSPWSWLLAACWLLAGPAAAASLQVSPISLEFAPDQQAQALWLSNSGEVPIQAQVRIVAWTQRDGRESLDPSTDLAASPPILQIEPGQRQLVRIVRPVVAAPGREMSYRLIIDELPGPSGGGSGLNFLLQYSVPVFVSPTPLPDTESVAAPPPTDASTLRPSLRLADGQARLSVENTGPRRIRLSQLEQVADDGTVTPLTAGLLGYALAGSRMEWPLPIQLPQGAAPPRLRVRFNDDRDPQVLALPPARP